MEGIWRLFHWLMILAYLNLLWLLFTLFGLVVFGVGPATASVFAILRKLLNNDDLPIWTMFNRYYRMYFWTANKVMCLIVPIGLFIYFDFIFLRMLPNTFFIDSIVFPAILILIMYFIIFCSYLFSVIVHFDLAFLTNVKYAILTAGINPLPTMLLLIGLFVFTVILLFIPALSIFYLVSVPVFIIQLCTRQSFDNINRRNSSNLIK